MVKWRDNAKRSIPITVASSCHSMSSRFFFSSFLSSLSTHSLQQNGSTSIPNSNSAPYWSYPPSASCSANVWRITAVNLFSSAHLFYWLIHLLLEWKEKSFFFPPTAEVWLTFGCHYLSLCVHVCFWHKGQNFCHSGLVIHAKSFCRSDSFTMRECCWWSCTVWLSMEEGNYLLWWPSMTADNVTGLVILSRKQWFKGL